MPGDEAVRELLRTARTIAVVGLSSNPMRASFGVAEYMQSRGYNIVPVNPNEQTVLGAKAMKTLDDVEGAVDIVNVFRRSEFVPDIIEAAIRKQARCVWMQQGIIHNEAARRAEEAGLLVMMDRCILQEYRRLVR